MDMLQWGAQCPAHLNAWGECRVWDFKIPLPITRPSWVALYVLQWGSATWGCLSEMLDWGPEGERPFSRQRLWLEFKPLVFRSWYFLLCQTVLSFLCSFSTYTTYYSNHSHWNRKSAHDLIALEYFLLPSQIMTRTLHFTYLSSHFCTLVFFFFFFFVINN